ncbi:MAG: acyltransferase family protein [Isosphaeraceae bacterium]
MDIAEPPGPDSPVTVADANRYHALDALRAIMMLLGVVIHTAISYGAAPSEAYWPYKDAATTPLCDLLVAWIHSFRMPLFFVLAGFFAALLADRRGLAGMLKNRAKRILLPFLAALILLTPLIRMAFLFTWRAGSYRMPESIAAMLDRGESPPIQTMHLWFLYQLLYFYAAAALLSLAAGKLPGAFRGRFSEGFRALAGNPFARPFALGLLTMITVLPNPLGVVGTSISMAPDPAILLANGAFFGFGWCFYGCRDLLGGWKRLAWTQVLLATFLVIPIQIAAMILLFTRGETARPAAWIVSAGATGLQSWLMIFGITGLFLRYADFHSRPLRYLTDASYWVYLAHLPLVIFMTGLFATLPLPALVKMTAVTSISVALLLASYHVLVRPTIVGEWLGGVRHPIFRRGSAIEPAAEPAAS